MDVSTSIIFIIVTAFALSFAWGMRGSLVGGEKGAMLPGALFGLLFSAFSGSDVIRSNFHIFSAVGASAMFLGGTMTYSETLDLCSDGVKSKTFARGIEGIILKGWCWFGLAGGFMSLAFVVATGTVYTLKDLIIFFLLAYPISRLGLYIFNRPFDLKKNIFPRFYFSKTRRENWGATFLLLLAFMAFAFVKKDIYTFVFCFFSGLSGAIGWATATFAYVYSRKRMKNGKYFFGALQENKIFDNWKLMECVFGAIGGAGTAATYCILNDQTQSMISEIEKNSELWSPLKDYGFIIFVVWLIIWFLGSVRVFFWHKPQRSAIIRNRNTYLITKSEYRKFIVDADELGPPKWFKRWKAVGEEIDFWSYSFIPMCLSVLGCVKVAQATSVFLIFWVLAEKLCFKTYLCRKELKLITTVMMSISALLLLGVFMLDTGYSIFIVLLLYSVVYEIMSLHRHFRLSKLIEVAEITNGFKEFAITFGKRITVEPYFVVSVVVLVVFGAITLI